MATVTLRPNADGTYHTWDEIPNAGHVYSTQFEEGDFTPWTGTSCSAGETATVEVTDPHHGTYHGSFYVDGVATGEYAYAYKTIAGQTTLFARVYVKFITNLPTSGRIFTFLAFYAGASWVANAVIIHDGTDVHWRLTLRDGAAAVNSDSVGTVSLNTRYCVELEVVIADLGEGRLYVDAAKVCELTEKDTNNYGNLTSVRVGEIYTTGWAEHTTRIDCVVVANAGPIGVESRKDLVDDESDNTALRVTRYAAETVAYTTRKTTYNLTDHGAEVDPISNVTLYCRAKYNTGGGNETFNLIMKLGATEVTEGKTAGAAFADFSYSRSTDPDGGAWSWADVDALEVGAVPTALDAGEDITISEFWIVVTYGTTVILRPNADGTYHTWSELPNSGHIFSNQVEEGDLTAWTGTLVGVGSSVAADATQLHHGLYSVKAIQALANDNALVYETIGAVSTLVSRVYFRLNALPTNGKFHWFLRFGNGATAICSLGIYNNAGTYQLAVYNHHTISSTRANININAEQWYRGEMKLVRDAVAGALYGWFDTAAEGSPTVSSVGVDTGDSDVTRISVGSVSSGEICTNWIECVVASASYIGVEDRHELVDDDPADDNTALRVECFAGETVAYTARKTTYNLTDSADLGAISNVTAYCRAKYSAGGGNEGFKLIWKLAATEVQSVEKTPSDVYAEFSDSRNTDPDGGAWSWADVNNLEVGAVASTLAATESIDISEFWIVVTYGAAAGQQLFTLINQEDY